MGPCHHGVARPQVADGGTPSNVKDSYEYIKYAAADHRQEVVFELGVGRCAHRKMYHVTNRSQRKPRTWTDPLVRLIK